MKYVEDLQEGDTFADATVLDAPERLDDGTVRVVVRQADGERVERTYQAGTVVQQDPHNRQRGMPQERR